MSSIVYIGPDERGRNYVILSLAVLTMLFAGYWEGYLSKASALLWFLTGFGVAMAIWLASFITSIRLISLIMVVFLMEYAKETIGIKAGFWEYSNPNGFYLFGVWLWVFCGVTAFTTALCIVIPLLKNFRLESLSFIKLPAVLLFLAVAFVMLPHRMEAEHLPGWKFYYATYILLAAICVYAAYKADIYVFLGVALTSLALGLPAEYSGSYNGSIWSFCVSQSGESGACLPPVFLLAGCWPLEIFAQYALSAWIAGETLEKYTETEPEEGAMGVILTRKDRQFKWFMILSAFTYFVVGFIFLLAPKFVFHVTNAINSGVFRKLGFDWLNVYHMESAFYVSLTFSMMMTITLLCVIVALEPRNNRLYTIPLLTAKAASAVSGLALFLFSAKYFGYLVIFMVDGSIFVLTLVFFLRSYLEDMKDHKHLFRKHAPHTWKPKAERDGPVAGRVVPDESGLVDWRPGEGGMGGSGPCKVVVVTGGEKFKMLDQAIKDAGFWETLDHHFGNSNKSKEDYRVVIKPNFMFLHDKKDVSTYTDPAMVEHLVDEIHKRGFTNITLVEAQSTLGNYYSNRDVVTVALYAGYHKGRNYRIADLTEEMEPFDYGGRLGNHFVGKSWKEADFRVSFAKNKTHVFCNYTLTLKNIYGTLPMQNKLLEYHTKREYDWPTIESFRHFPVHFGIIDAVISADGQFGVITDPTPCHTKTVIAGENLIAVDWVGARKMGLDPDDPEIGRFVPLAVKAFGMPEFVWVGDRSVYEPWQNVSDVFIKSLDIVEEAYAFSDFCFSGLSAMDGYFKFKLTAWPNHLMRKILEPFKRVYYKYDNLD